MTQHTEYTVLGKGHKLIDGLEKVTGHAKFTADLNLAGMLHARPVLSFYAHAKIISINTDAALAMPGVVAVLTASDLVTKDRISNSRSSAVLAKDEVVFAGQFVAVVVATTEAAAQDALALVEVDYEPLPVVWDMMAALEPDAPIIWAHGVPQEGADLTALHGNSSEGEDTVQTQASNVLEVKNFGRGDVAQGFAASSVIVEHTYQTAWVHQAYLEPHAVVAEPGVKLGQINVYTSTQGQYAVRNEVARLLSLKQADVKVVPMNVGGGFGAKYGLIDPLVAAIALKLQKPVKMVLTRTEDMMTTTPASASRLELKTGASSDGRVMAIQAKVYFDNGIYPFGFPGIIGMLMGGYYKCDHYQLEIVQVATNKPQAGAYRAPGAPQVTFALESNIDEMALALNIDPLEFRIKNGVETGDLSGVGRAWPKIGLQACLEKLSQHPAWKNRHQRSSDPSPQGASLASRSDPSPQAFPPVATMPEGAFSGQEGASWEQEGASLGSRSDPSPQGASLGSRSDPDTLEGVGIAIGGWPGAFSPAGAVCRVDTDGTVRLHVGSVDISGVHSSLVLIAAEQLGVDPSAVQIVQGDTESGPYAPASGGSQVTVSVSGAVQDASVQVRNQLLEIAASELEAHKDDLELKNGAAQVKGVPEKAIAIGQLARLAQTKAGGPGPIVAEGRAAMKSGAPGFTVQLARVSVNKHTGVITPLEFVAVQDVGFALNPTLIEGQMHGGSAQGLSMGLFESMRYDQSGILNSANFLEYHFPRATDLPPFEAVILQEPSESGPFGARIVGEPPIISGGAAIANAIRDAVGVRVLELPVRPETLWKLMQAK